jgi:hypothetical protein
MVEVLVLLRHYDPCGNFKMFSISLANIKLIPDIRAEYQILLITILTVRGALEVRQRFSQIFQLTSSVIQSIVSGYQKNKMKETGVIFPMTVSCFYIN